ncbi:MAG: hypothetical protein B5M53_12105 [Candidatus Cloacimonas sp. 4484_209]|nr:MAG: hypothetical protein B5M53_12105 [Candidatus Cloacimonas sp. 4484_209]
MTRGVIWFLFVFGIFLLIIGGLLPGFHIFKSIGILMILAGLALAAQLATLKKEEVIDNWSILIENGNGRAEDIFRDTNSFILETKVPAITIKREGISPSMLRGVLGRKRDFLTVIDRRNIRLKPYKIFINARDYGKNLDVSWYLTFKPELWKRILALVPFVSIVPKKLSDLDIFDQQDLRAYATNAHHCVIKAVEKLMLSLGQDPAKIDRRSRGFLGIS